MKSPNWTPEELKLALELYLDRDMQWHSKISNTTWEIMALSELLRGLDVVEAEKGEKFRSPSSIRLKLANFKSLDERYGNSAMSNVGNQDKAIWNQYHCDYILLKEECELIIETHYKGKPSDNLSKYLDRFNGVTSNKTSLDTYAKELIELAKEFRTRAVEMEDIDFSQKVMESCYDIIKNVEKEDKDKKENNMVQKPKEKKKSHAGVNQEKINSDEKIGKHVKSTMLRLIEEGKLDTKTISLMMDADWSREYFHLGHPFMLKIDRDSDLTEQITDENGYVRYWKDTFLVDGETFCFCKEWFESQRKHFDKWLTEFESIKKINLSAENLKRLLEKIKVLDEKNICISVTDVKESMKDILGVTEAVERLLEMRVLSEFQGSAREVVVEDYDLLYAMINNPNEYIQER